MPYTAPVDDFKFLLDHVVGLPDITATERFAEATPDLVDAILNGAGRLCTDVIAPLNRVGDAHPARLENGTVRMAPGFETAWRSIAEGGWIGLAADPEHGGTGLPQALNTAVMEMMAGACLALQIAPLLSQGQIEALEAHGDPDLKARVLPKLISGDWTGTMNLTEPQAGSDVGAVATSAVPAGDGTFAVTGQKIYISFGDHDLAENVCHLVLARQPGAALGTRGLSLFLVPKILPGSGGAPGPRNAVRVLGLEDKMGLHGAPTCVMAFEGATGWRVGPNGGGMAAMFTMMNNARLGVGVQGIGVAEAAWQAALAFACERVQGGGAILRHADVQRMLAGMRADIFAARAIALACGAATDMARAVADGGGAEDGEWAARAALLTPIAKAFGTETGMDAARTCVQVHGGMGVIEETGVAQFSRDVRVTAIYEGTNGIQAMDLVGRKLADGGAAVERLITEVQEAAEAARTALPELAGAVWEAAEALRDGTDWMLAEAIGDARFAGAVPYLRAFARVLGAHYHLRAALAAGGEGPRAALAAVYVRRRLPEYRAALAEARAGAGDLHALDLAAGAA